MTLMNFLRLTAVLSFYFLISPHVLAQGKNEWPEVTPAEMQMSKGVVDAAADAEVLNWEVRIEDQYFRTTGYKTTLDHYLRVKIFTERGREQFSKFDIPFGKVEDLRIKVEIKDIAARTVTPGGTTHLVKATDIFDQDSVKADGVKLRVKSFALPGITVGSIVEFRWREIRSNSVSNYMRIQYSREIPVQRVRYSVKPVAFPRGALAMRIHSANVTSNFVKEKDDFYSITMTGVPALRSEPRMRAPFEIEPWSLIYYADPDVDTKGADKYWEAVAKANAESHEKLLKFDGAVRQAAEQAVAGAGTSEDRAKRIFDYCRRNIKHVSEEDDEAKPPATSSEILKRRSGTWHDIDMLFASMLNAVGIEARVANVTRKDDPQFDKGLTNDYFIRTELIAAKIDGKWAFFDFSNKHLPYGLLPSTVEGQDVLISGPTAEWAKTPATPSGSSAIRRIANAGLESDGSIVGDIQLSFSGHPGAAFKKVLIDYSHEAREKWLADMLKREVHSLAEASAIAFNGVDDPETPLSVSFKLRVPGYATATGRRLFLNPNIFKRNALPEFSSGVRYNDVSFNYRWTEVDEITLRIPPEFEIESSEAPHVTSDEGISISNRVVIERSADRLTYKRQMNFEGHNGLVFDRSAYSRIKGVFDEIGKANEHMIALRQK